MKVLLSATLDIDPEKWTMNYGVYGEDRIRADVKMHFEDAVRSLYGKDGLDLLKDGS